MDDRDSQPPDDGDAGDNSSDDDSNGAQHRMALGIAIGTSFGVTLSVLMDNWGMLGIGIAVGVAFGAIPSPGAAPDEDDPHEDS